MMFDEDHTGLGRAYVAYPVRLEDGVITALEWALARAHNDLRQINLTVPLVAVLNDTPVLQEMQRAGVNVVRERRRGPSGVIEGPIIVYAPDLESLAEVEEAKRSTAIVAVGAHDGQRPWVSAFRPEYLAGAVIEPKEPIVGDPVVWQAMLTFTNSINSSTGLAHSSDRSRVIDGLMKLRRSGHRFDPNDLVAAALRLNWRGSAAIELRDLAREINAGKNKRITYGRYRDDIVQMWEVDAAG